MDDFRTNASIRRIVRMVLCWHSIARVQLLPNFSFLTHASMDVSHAGYLDSQGLSSPVSSFSYFGMSFAMRPYLLVPPKRLL